MGMPATHMRHHLHVPWMTIILVIVAVAIAAAVLYAVNRETTTEAPAVSVIAPVASTAAVPRAENRAFFNLINWWIHDYKTNMRPAAVMADYAALHQPVETAERVAGPQTDSGGGNPGKAYQQIHLQPE